MLTPGNIVTFSFVYLEVANNFHLSTISVKVVTLVNKQSYQHFAYSRKNNSNLGQMTIFDPNFSIKFFSIKNFHLLTKLYLKVLTLKALLKLKVNFWSIVFWFELPARNWHLEWNVWCMKFYQEIASFIRKSCIHNLCTTEDDP